MLWRTYFYYSGLYFPSFKYNAHFRHSVCKLVYYLSVVWATVKTCLAYGDTALLPGTSFKGASLQCRIVNSTCKSSLRFITDPLNFRVCTDGVIECQEVENCGYRALMWVMRSSYSNTSGKLRWTHIAKELESIVSSILWCFLKLKVSFLQNKGSVLIFSCRPLLWTICY